MKKFALIGASGYIAPRHINAIKHIGGNLLACLDPHDSIGYIDSSFPYSSYFRETERFDRHIDRLRRKNQPIDYVSICSPNYLHDSHIRLALRNQCNVICEKPLVLKSEHIESLKYIENETGKKVNSVLQLRHHPLIQELKEKYKNTNKIHQVNLDYITPRGLWYEYSWKGDIQKSGGVATNIGIHFFDMLIYIFGDVRDFEVLEQTPQMSKGVIQLDHADVNFKLSIDKKDLPWEEWKPFRCIEIDGGEVEFSQGFTDLHNISYDNIIKGNGFGLDDVLPSIKLVEQIRNYA